MTHSTDASTTDPAEFWEARYLAERGESGQVWSGRVNAAVEHEVTGLAPGTALELGCGEGGDAIWLAAHGWAVTAVDISANALAVAAEKATLRGLATRIDWVQADLAAWHPSTEYDLVTAAFLHSPVELPRAEILRRATTAVAPGGRLLVVGHGALPPGAGGDHDHEHEHEHEHETVPLPSPDEVLAGLELPDGWVVETNGLLERSVARNDGTAITIVDTVLRVRREAHRRRATPMRRVSWSAQ